MACMAELRLSHCTTLDSTHPVEIRMNAITLEVVQCIT